MSVYLNIYLLKVGVIRGVVFFKNRRVVGINTLLGLYGFNYFHHHA